MVLVLDSIYRRAWCPKKAMLPPLHLSLRQQCALSRGGGVAPPPLIDAGTIFPSSQHRFLRAEAKPPQSQGTTPAGVGIPTSHDSQSPTAGPGGNSKTSTNRGPGPGPQQQPGGPREPNTGDGLSFQLRYWILLLAEYGGVYGTAAVLIAALTHVDAFGGLHWGSADVALGVGLMAPALVFDALVGLPDWTTRDEDAAQLVRLFVDPELLQKGREDKGTAATTTATTVIPSLGHSATASPSSPVSTEDNARADVQAVAPLTSTSTLTTEAADTDPSRHHSDNVAGSSSTRERNGIDDIDLFIKTRTEAAEGLSRPVAIRSSAISSPGARQAAVNCTASTTAPDAPASSSSSRGSDISSSSSTSSSSSGSTPNSGARKEVGQLWAAAQRLRMALELMQDSSIRNNPGARLTPLQEALVILVAVTADEMLYRAVLLTLFGCWLRDRAYEAGADEVVTLQLLSGGPGGYGGGGGSTWQLDTSVVAQWGAVGVGLVLGAAVFAAKAWQEASLAERLRAVQAAQAEEVAKELRKQRLLGQHMSEDQLREEREKVARLQAAQASLVASIGVQGALVWMMEGGREVYQVAASGASFLLTGNLAAPLAGSLVAQLLVSVYQRLGLRRTLQRRVKVLEARRRSAQEKRQQQQLQQQQATATTTSAEAMETTAVLLETAATELSALAAERPANEEGSQAVEAASANAAAGAAGLEASSGGHSTVVEGPMVEENEPVAANATAGGRADGAGGMAVVEGRRDGRQEQQQQ